VAKLLAAARAIADGGSATSPEPAPIPAEEPDDRGGLTWARWNAARKPKSHEERQRELEANNEFHWRRVQAGAQPSRARFIDVGPEPGTHKVRTRHRDGEWSAPEAVTDQMIEAERQHSPSWAETERRARAALRGLRRAEQLLRGLRVVPPPRPQGWNEHRPGHRPATGSRGPPSGDDGDLDEPPPRRSGLRHIFEALRVLGYLDDEPLAAGRARLGGDAA
jgi:hypothetical protein